MTQSIRIHTRYDLGGPPRIVIATVRDKVGSYWFLFIPHINTTLKQNLLKRTLGDAGQGSSAVAWEHVYSTRPGLCWGRRQMPVAAESGSVLIRVLWSKSCTPRLLGLGSEAGLLQYQLSARGRGRSQRRRRRRHRRRRRRRRRRRPCRRHPCCRHTD